MKSHACVLLIGCLVHGSVFAACRDIAVVSRDAQFMVLNSSTLEIKDVGNLWWLGIRVLNNGVGNNFTLDVLASPEVVVDPISGERLNSVIDDDGYITSTVDSYFLENLGRNYRTQTEIPKINYKEQGITPEWATYSSSQLVQAQDQIVDFILSGHRYDNVEHNRFAVSDLSFNLIVDGFVSSSADSAVCQSGGRFYVAGGREAWSFDSLTGQVQYADWPDQDYVMLSRRDGCRLLARPRGDAVDPDSDWRLIDFSTGEILSRFDLDTFGRSHLFDNGSRWLIQKGRRGEHNVLELTPEFILVDTFTGKILSQGELDINGAELPYNPLPQRFCESGSDEERVVALRRPLGDDSRTTLYLIDARTLSVLNSITLPFRERVWAF